MSILLIATIVVALAQSINGYGLFYEPGAVITKLEVAMIMPEIPAAPGIHYIWPGLQPNGANFVFQDVAGDYNGGSWTFSEWTVDSNANYNKTDDVTVYLGDSIDILFSLDTHTGEWLNRWTTTPGSTGQAAGETYTVASTIALESQSAAYGNLTQALFIIELQEGATWNFGTLTFSNITIEAQTTSTDWCYSPYRDDAFTSISGETKVEVHDNTYTTCKISYIDFIAPGNVWGKTR
ncbi:hypothetical protein B0J14DRAFT_654860 [Halenospora varia]|nr:hypothetical protein B0J14DRAFT_654860 [Halenospora varia]